MISRTAHFYCTVKAVCRNALAAVLALSSVSQATSVIGVSLEEMLQNSTVVFEGQVVDIQVRENANHAIQTLVTFEIFDVIRGDVQGRKMTLEFLGGELAGRKLSVSAMQMPVLKPTPGLLLLRQLLQRDCLNAVLNISMQVFQGFTASILLHASAPRLRLWNLILWLS